MNIGARVYYPCGMRAWGAPTRLLKASDADSDAVSRFQDGDESAFEDLVFRHEREAYQAAYRILGNSEDAQEAVQESFLRAFRALKAFRGEAAFKTWLTGIVINVCRNQAAKAEEKLRRLSISTDCGEDDDGVPRTPAINDPGPGPEQSAFGSELHKAVEAALGKVGAEHREVLVLREIQGMEYEELAAALNCPVGTVKSRLCRARRALREALLGVWP